MLIALVILAAVVGLFVVLYNGLVNAKNSVDEAWSGIDVQLKRRYDLIPNLVNVVKGYVKHEHDTLVELTEARARAQASLNQGPQGARSVGAAESLLGEALMHVYAVAENYPDLKANENFMQLQGQLATIEEELSMARRDYNGTVKALNNRIMQFPSNFVASFGHFAKADYFEIQNQQEREVPLVQF